MDTPKQFFKSGRELVDYPGWFKIDGGTEDDSNLWSVVRKPDGSWWWVAAHHIFPPGGGTLRLADSYFEQPVIANARMTNPVWDNVDSRDAYFVLERHLVELEREFDAKKKVDARRKRLAKLKTKRGKS